MRSESDVDKMIDDLISRTKGDYITQGVTFSKKDPRQLRLLKFALMESLSFSGLAKEMLLLRYIDNDNQSNTVTRKQPPQPTQSKEARTFDVDDVDIPIPSDEPNNKIKQNASNWLS